MKDSVIAKFGGTSVSSKKTIQAIVEIASNEQHLVIVVSALSGVTDLLLSVAQEVGETESVLAAVSSKHEQLVPQVLTDATRRKEVISYVDESLLQIHEILQKEKKSLSRTDQIISFGERLSSFLITQVLRENGLVAQQIVATELIITDDSFGSAEFMAEETKKQTTNILMPLLNKNIVPVVTGFIGATKKGNVTTLGRGGSDYTAAILGFALQASEIQIWTDVNGMYTTDPRLEKKSRHITRLSYREAAELAAFGAKILHPKTIRPAIHAGIPVRILNTFDMENIGTLIEFNPPEAPRALAVSAKKEVILITMVSHAMLFSKGFLERIFRIFAKHNLSVDLVSVSEVSVSVTLDTTIAYEEAVKELQSFTKVMIREDVGIVSLIGHEIIKVAHIMKSIFTVLDKENIPVAMISLGATDINISLVLQKEHVLPAVKKLHNEIILKKQKGME